MNFSSPLLHAAGSAWSIKLAVGKMFSIFIALSAAEPDGKMPFEVAKKETNDLDTPMLGFDYTRYSQSDKELNGN